ncbi:hypothetical protein [Mucilaginibacter ginsenosidivorax]|nr:hypothetical protein [Mucilaginibacter ginsenosidivorax]
MALIYLLFSLPWVKTRGYNIGRTYGSFFINRLLKNEIELHLT